MNEAAEVNTPDYNRLSEEELRRARAYQKKYDERRETYQKFWDAGYALGVRAGLIGL